LIGRSREELAAGLRSIAFGRYVVFYLILEDHVEIARVIHGSRDFRRALTER
jgi:toxin ParE1/3/4